MDYVAFCGEVSPIQPLKQELRVSVIEFSRLSRDEPHILIDVRDCTQYSVCSLQGSINIPWTGDAESWNDRVTTEVADNWIGEPCYVICKLGNDSQLAVVALSGLGVTRGKIKNVDGGFKAWREQVDSTWPDY
jgi:adenylyltransferase/sulfurtransferase